MGVNRPHSSHSRLELLRNTSLWARPILLKAHYVSWRRRPSPYSNSWWACHSVSLSSPTKAKARHKIEQTAYLRFFLPSSQPLQTLLRFPLLVVSRSLRFKSFAHGSASHQEGRRPRWRRYCSSSTPFNALPFPPINCSISSLLISFFTQFSDLHLPSCWISLLDGRSMWLCPLPLLVDVLRCRVMWLLL